MENKNMFHKLDWQDVLIYQFIADNEPCTKDDIMNSGQRVVSEFLHSTVDGCLRRLEFEGLITKEDKFYMTIKEKT